MSSVISGDSVRERYPNDNSGLFSKLGPSGFVNSVVTPPPPLPPPFRVPHYQPQQAMQQQFQQQHWSQQCYNYNTLMYCATTSSTANKFDVVTDWRRIQGMESTITHLKALLSKEVNNNKVEKEGFELLKEEVEALRASTKLLEKQLQDALSEQNSGQEDVVAALEDISAAKKELSANREELKTAQSELTTARKVINELTEANAELECKIAELLKTVEDLKISSKNTGVGDVDKCVKPLDEEVESALKSQIDHLKLELESVTESKNFQAKLFSELGRKYLHMMAYSAEQMYNDFTQRHTVFIKNLKGESEKFPANEAKCSMIKQTLDVLQGQLDAIKECREKFKIVVEIRMNRLSLGLALVSDLNIRPPKPQFQIPFENFDHLHHVISSMGEWENRSSDDSTSLSESDQKSPLK